MTSAAARASSNPSGFFDFLPKVAESFLAKPPPPLSYSTNVNQVRKKVITFGSGTTGAGGLGSGKSPIKRKIVVHIARAACAGVL